MHLPDGWTFAEGAAFLVQALTAYYALVELGNLKNHQTVLIQSAAGGVGLLAQQIAKKFDAFTIGSVGHRFKIPTLEKAGYDGMIVRDKHFKNNLVKALASRDLDLVLECVGGRFSKKAIRYSAKQVASLSMALPGMRSQETGPTLSNWCISTLPDPK